MSVQFVSELNFDQRDGMPASFGLVFSLLAPPIAGLTFPLPVALLTLSCLSCRLPVPVVFPLGPVLSYPILSCPV